MSGSGSGSGAGCVVLGLDSGSGTRSLKLRQDIGLWLGLGLGRSQVAHGVELVAVTIVKPEGMFRLLLGDRLHVGDIRFLLVLLAIFLHLVSLAAT